MQKGNGGRSNRFLTLSGHVGCEESKMTLSLKACMTRNFMLPTIVTENGGAGKKDPVFTFSHVTFKLGTRHSGGDD